MQIHRPDLRFAAARLVYFYLAVASTLLVGAACDSMPIGFAFTLTVYLTAGLPLRRHLFGDRHRRMLWQRIRRLTRRPHGTTLAVDTHTTLKIERTPNRRVSRIHRGPDGRVVETFTASDYYPRGVRTVASKVRPEEPASFGWITSRPSDDELSELVDQLRRARPVTGP